MGKCLTFLRQINVEPMLFLYGIAYSLYQNVYVAFFTYKECVGRLMTNDRVIRNIREFCLSLGQRHQEIAIRDNRSASNFDSATFLNEVQASTALYSIVYQVANTLPAVLAALFMGAWCDSHGRKPIILIATAGTTVSFALSLVTACMDSWPLSTMTGTALIKSMTGQGVITNLAAFAMISDVATTKSMFTIRIGIASGAISLGGFVGSLISASVLARWDNFAYIFLLASAFSAFSFFYTLIGVVETYQWAIRRRASLIQDPDVGYDDEPMDAFYDCHSSINYDHDPGNLFLDMIMNMRESIRVLIRKRLGNRRLYLLITLSASMILVSCEPSGIINLYLKRPPLSFSDSQFSYYMATTTAAGVVGAMVMPVILKRFIGIPDISLVMIGIFVGICRKCLIAFSVESWMIFLAAGTGSLSAMHVTGLRSYLPSLVHRTETGRLFAAISSLEHCGPLFSALVINNIYAATIDWYPGAAFVIAAFIATSMFVLISLIQMDSQIIDGCEIKWSDDIEEMMHHRLSTYDEIATQRIF